jgi:hypothetical protein
LDARRKKSGDVAILWNSGHTNISIQNPLYAERNTSVYPQDEYAGIP